MNSKGINYMMVGSCLFVLLLSPGFAWADSDELRAMSRNLYLGGGLTPPITIERGFVGVAAGLPDGSGVNFVTTHLEVREVGPVGLLQALQAQELISDLDGLNAPATIGRQNLKLCQCSKGSL
jgi:hypothetical protein